MEKDNTNWWAIGIIFVFIITGVGTVLVDSSGISYNWRQFGELLRGSGFSGMVSIVSIGAGRIYFTKKDTIWAWFIISIMSGVILTSLLR